MNICLLNDSFPPVIDGVVNVVQNYAAILGGDGPSGDRVIVGTPRYPGTDYTGYPYEVVPYRSIDTEKAASGYRAGDPFDMRALRDMAAFRPDVIHAHSPASAAIMARVLRNMTDAPVIYTYHTKYDIDIARAVRGELMQKEAVRAIVENVSACDEVWAVSRGAGENLRSLGYEGEIRVMPNGVDFPKGRADEDAVAEVVRGYDLPEGVPVFLFVGRIMNYKGLPLILDALRILFSEGRRFRMVFVGGGDDLASLQKKAAEYGILKRVVFTGPIRDREALRAWNTRADLFVFPSTFDTNGLVVREAAACGLASLLIRGSCAAEGITDGRNGFLAEENAESIAAVLRNVMDEPESAAAAGQRAMDEIYLSWKDCVKSARARYEEVSYLYATGQTDERRPDAADYFLQLAARAAENEARVLDRRERFVEGMLGNAEALQEGLQSIRDAVRSERKALREELRESAESVRTDLRTLGEDIFGGRS